MINVASGKRFESFPASKLFIYSLSFLFALLIFESVFLSHSEEISILKLHFANGSYLKLAFLCLLSVFSLILTFLFFYFSLASPYKYRIIYFLIFSLAVCAEYNYQNAFQRFSLLEDFEIALVAADFKIATNSVLAYFNYLIIFPLTVYAFLLCMVKPSWDKGLKSLFICFALVGGFFFLTSFFTRNTFYADSFTAFNRTLISFPVTWYVGSLKTPPRRMLYYAKRDEIGFHSQNTSVNNVVFIVDESVRGDHLSLNGYERKTTPFIDELNQKGFIKNWGIAVSGTTCSLTSNFLMLTGLNNLPDQSFESYKMPTIFQYAKAMNYKTYYFDGQVSHFWNGKFSDISDYGIWTKPNDLNTTNRYENDAEIARRVKEIINNSTGNFIWITKFGMHPPYSNSYPISEIVWSPVTGSDNYKDFYSKNATSETLKNSYDNAILYNSQSFFSTLFNDGVSSTTIFVYTSDHGQTLSEHGEITSHCSNSFTEANVPLFIIANPKLMPDVDTNYLASHANLFATLLDTMNFPEVERKYDYSISLFKAKKTDSQPRFYFAGDLNGLENGQKYLYDK